MKKILTIFMVMFALVGCAKFDFLFRGKPLTVHFVGSAPLSNPLSPTVDKKISVAQFDSGVTEIENNRNVLAQKITKDTFANLGLGDIQWLDHLDEIHIFTVVNPLSRVHVGGEEFNLNRPAGFLFKGSITRDQLANWLKLW